MRWKGSRRRTLPFPGKTSRGCIVFIVRPVFFRGLPVIFRVLLTCSSCIEPPTYRKLLERRQERGGQVRCARCGNENLDGNRFCGMCGATLLTTSVPVAAPPAQSSATRSTVPAAPSSFPPGPAAGAQPQNPPSSRTSAPVSEQEPYISGPSFLGLNQPAPRKRANLSFAPHGRRRSS